MSRIFLMIISIFLVLCTFRIKAEKQYQNYRNPLLSLRPSDRLNSRQCIDDLWKDYKEICDADWDQSSKEDKIRRKRWEYKYRQIELDNHNDPQYTEVQTCQMHLSKEEFARRYLGAVPLSLRKSPALDWSKIHKIDQIKQNDGPSTDKQQFNDLEYSSFVQNNAPQLPDYVNWHNVVQLPVRDQLCGDCWAHSGTSALEALNQIIGNQYQQFSVQNYVNCAGPPPNKNGCNGGNSANVFNYTQKYGAVAYNNNPYTGIYNSADKCSNSTYQKLNIFFVTGQGQAIDECYQIKAAVNRQPIVVFVYVDDQFNQATTSIIQDTLGDANHAVLLIGYTPTYWVIQNSWGTDSQYNGFCRIAIGNTRQICSNGYWPTSSAIYKLTPQTAPYTFINALTAVPLSSIIYAPVNMKALIGSKFSIQDFSQSIIYSNTKGESMQKINPTYYLTANNGPKNSAGNYTVAFQFVTNLTKAFRVNFDNGPVGNNNGYLKSTNLVNNNTFLLGYCGSYNTQANDEGVLQRMCPLTPNATQYVIIFNPKNTDYFSISWYIPLI